MATLHSHVGDTIVIDRKEYEVIQDPTTREELFTLQLKALMCKACGENDVDGDEGWEAYCPGCINQAMRWVIVLETIENNVPGNVQKVMEFDSEEIKRSRVGSYQYIELNSAAKDSINCESDDEIREQVQDVFDVVLRAVLRGTGR